MRVELHEFTTTITPLLQPPCCLHSPPSLPQDPNGKTLQQKHSLSQENIYFNFPQLQRKTLVTNDEIVQIIFGCKCNLHLSSSCPGRSVPFQAKPRAYRIRVLSSLRWQRSGVPRSNASRSLATLETHLTLASSTYTIPGFICPTFPYKQK